MSDLSADNTDINRRDLLKTAGSLVVFGLDKPLVTVLSLVESESMTQHIGRFQISGSLLRSRESLATLQRLVFSQGVVLHTVTDFSRDVIEYVFWSPELFTPVPFGTIPPLYTFELARVKSVIEVKPTEDGWCLSTPTLPDVTSTAVLRRVVREDGLVTYFKP